MFGELPLGIYDVRHGPVWKLKNVRMSVRGSKIFVPAYGL